MLAFDQFRLDAVNQCLWRGDARIALKPKPFAVLEYLIAHAGRLVTQDNLLAVIWPDAHVQSEVLRQYILEIRRVLGDRPEASRFIQTFPRCGYQFIAPVTDEDAMGLPAAANTPPTLVGRASSLADLERSLELAERGRRQIMFVVGEAGIGKTTLIDAFQQRVSTRQAVRVARGHPVEGFAGKECYYPIFEALAQLARGPAGTAVVNALATQAPTWMMQLPALVSPERRAAPHREVAGATRERMVREFCDATEAFTNVATVVIVLEDLHRADCCTLDVISAIARRREAARLMLIGTLRPADLILSDSPLKTLKHDLVLHRLAHELTLERLERSDVAEYLATALSDSELPEQFATIIHRHSDGNPLFMTATIEHLEQRRVLSNAGGRWRLTVPVEQVDPGVPDTLKQMLEMQLHRLNDADRRLLGSASIVGQRFTVWAVATMLSRGTAETHEQCCDLAERQQFVEACGIRALPNGAETAEFAFRHALYREVLYQSLNVAERAKLRRQLAEALEGVRGP